MKKVHHVSFVRSFPAFGYAMSTVPKNDEWVEMTEEERVLINPELYRSPMVDINEEFDTDRLLDQAIILDPLIHKSTIIWLHGIGTEKEKMSQVFQMLRPKDCRIVIPNAPKLPITALGDEEERTWYDLISDKQSEEHEDDDIGIEESHHNITALLEEECALIDSRNIVLAGFAQGGAMAIHSGLHYHLPLAGILSFCGYVVLPEMYPDWISTANTKTSICALHGQADAVVPFDFAMGRYKVLQNNGIPLAFREDFHMDHYMSEHMMREMQNWFIDTLKVN